MDGKTNVTPTDIGEDFSSLNVSNVLAYLFFKVTLILLSVLNIVKTFIFLVYRYSLLLLKIDNLPFFYILLSLNNIMRSSLIVYILFNFSCQKFLLSKRMKRNQKRFFIFLMEFLKNIVLMRKRILQLVNLLRMIQILYVISINM